MMVTDGSEIEDGKASSAYRGIEAHLAGCSQNSLQFSTLHLDSCSKKQEFDERHLGCGFPALAISTSSPRRSASPVYLKPLCGSHFAIHEPQTPTARPYPAVSAHPINAALSGHSFLCIKIILSTLGTHVFPCHVYYWLNFGVLNSIVGSSLLCKNGKAGEFLCG